jgi:hypothetical protein
MVEGGKFVWLWRTEDVRDVSDRSGGICDYSDTHENDL